jgi:hypothetical protein
MDSSTQFTLLAVAFYLFGVFCLCVGCHLRAKIRHLLTSASTAQGSVISVETAPSIDSDRAYHPVFTFRDTKGVEHHVRSSVGDYPASHQIGQPVEVFYHPQAPHEAIINPGAFQTMARILFFAAIMAAVFGTAILILEHRA